MTNVVLNNVISLNVSYNLNKNICGYIYKISQIIYINIYDCYTSVPIFRYIILYLCIMYEYDIQLK